MPDRLNWVLIHGWGFDASVWNSWNSHLSPVSNIYTPDRGYFQSVPNIKPVLKNPHHTVVVTHSVGLHFIPPAWWDRIKNLVVISGFLSFHPVDSVGERRSRKILDRMIDQMKTEPDLVLGRFYRNCYKPYTAEFDQPGPVHTLQLMNDLQLLNDHELESEYLKQPRKLLILHGANDRIVDSRKSEDLHNRLPGSVLHIHRKQGHALPFMQPDWCIEQINDWLIEHDER